MSDFKRQFNANLLKDFIIYKNRVGDFESSKEKIWAEFWGLAKIMPHIQIFYINFRTLAEN